MSYLIAGDLFVHEIQFKTGGSILFKPATITNLLLFSASLNEANMIRKLRISKVNYEFGRTAKVLTYNG